jgi:hypothetical protein
MSTPELARNFVSPLRKEAVVKRIMSQKRTRKRAIQEQKRPIEEL